MALRYITDQTAATNQPGYYVLAIKEALLDAGWILKGSGDGTSNFSNTATETNTAALDYFTDATVASRNSAWFRVRTPQTLSNGTYRELTFQSLRYSSSDMGGGPFGSAYDFGTGGAIRIKYSLCISGSGFVSGTISANSGTTPSSKTVGDEYIVVGANVGKDTGSYDSASELAGGRLISINWNSINYYWSTIANDQPPYNFGIFGYAKTSIDNTTFFGFINMLSGSYDILDADPNIFVTYGYRDTFYGTVYGYQQHRGILGYGTPDQAMVELSRQNPINIGQGHINGEDNMLPSRFYRLASATTPRGWKGLSTFMLDLTTYDSRTNLDTFSVNSTKDKIFLKNFFLAPTLILPWYGFTPSI